MIFQHDFTKQYWNTFALKRRAAIRNHVHVLKGNCNIGDACIALLAVESNVISVDDDTASTSAAAAAAAATIVAVQNVNPSKAQQAGSAAASAVMSAAAAVYTADDSVIPKSKYDKLLKLVNGGSRHL